jgi:5-methylcytosine-specific restriction endonuclease McrA
VIRERAGDDMVAFAERVLNLLEQGSKVATYKYAVLLGLLDLCLEKTQRDGTAPTSVTTRELALKVVELYWPHSVFYEEARGVLRQNSGGQTTILSDVIAFREKLPDPGIPLPRARVQAPERFERLVRRVEWTLIKMPLPRLQVVSGRNEPLLYQIGWGLEIDRRKSSVVQYQDTGGGDFDNAIRFLDGVGEWLVRLNGLLRPLIQRGWTSKVAQMNTLEAARLESFLFGAQRVALEAVRPALLELQGGRCFYCDKPLGRQAHVDHFIPWSRFPDNSIDNLVLADPLCNGSKSDFIAARPHLARWAGRNRTQGAELARIAGGVGWESHPDKTLGVARGVYLRLAPSALLWTHGKEFDPVVPEEIRSALG